MALLRDGRWRSICVITCLDYYIKRHWGLAWVLEGRGQVDRIPQITSELQFNLCELLLPHILLLYHSVSITQGFQFTAVPYLTQINLIKQKAFPTSFSALRHSRLTPNSRPQQQNWLWNRTNDNYSPCQEKSGQRSWVHTTYTLWIPLLELVQLTFGIFLQHVTSLPLAYPVRARKLC